MWSRTVMLYIANSVAERITGTARELRHRLRQRVEIALTGHEVVEHRIGERLYVSPATAKTHVNRAMTKLGARDRAQLVVLAYESGLVKPGWL